MLNPIPSQVVSLLKITLFYSNFVNYSQKRFSDKRKKSGLNIVEQAIVRIYNILALGWMYVNMDSSVGAVQRSES